MSQVTEADGPDIYAVAYTRDDWAVYVGRTNEDINSAYSVTTPTFYNVSGGTLDIGTNGFNDLTNRKAAYIYDLIASDAWIYLVTNVGWNNNYNLSVKWTHDSSQVSSYFPIINAMNIQGTDGWDHDVILHEYGHFVMDKTYASYPDHPNCKPHDWHVPSSIGCAWSEGWATFLQAAIQNDGNYEDTEDNTFTINIELPDKSPYGPDVEGAVAASLWDIYDNLPENWDNHVSGINGISNNGIWRLFYDNDFTEVDQFENGWLNSANGYNAEVQSIFTHHGIGSVPPNLLGNPSFETDANADGKPDSWSTNTKFTRSTAILAIDGNYVGRFFATDNSAATITQVVNGLSAGTTYDFSGWVNIPPTSDSFTFKIQVKWRNASNTVIGTPVIIQSYPIQTSGLNGWSNALKSLVAPAGTTNAQIQMVVSSLNATIYVDRFRLINPASAPVPTQTPTPVGPTPTATPTRTPTPAGPTPTPTPTLSVSCNINLTPDSTSVAIGSSTTFTAAVTNVVGGAITNVIFTTSNVAVASVCGPGAVPCPSNQTSRTDPSSPYTAAATGQSNGGIFIIAQVTVAGNPNICGDISVLSVVSSTTPTSTPTPTRTPTPPAVTLTPTPTPSIIPPSLTPTPTPSGSCVLGSASWQNESFTNQTGTFTANFDVTPSSNIVDQGDVGLSNGPASAASNLAASIRFTSSGTIRAYNGATGSYAGSIPYSANVTYSFRIIVDLATDTYTAFVAPQGGAEQTLASGFALRFAATQLNNKAVKQASTTSGNINICNFTTIPS